MARKGRHRHRDPQETRDEIDRRRAKRKQSKTSLLVLSVAVAIVIILISTGVFYYIVNQPAPLKPYPSIVDAVGTKVHSGDTTLTTIKFTVRNNGTGTLDLTQVSLAWDGPTVQANLFMDKATYGTTSKDTYAVGGSGAPKDGWDPSSGKFLVKDGTVAWLVVNLTSQGGIGEPLGPAQGFRITLTIQGHGPGAGISDSVVFKVPSDFGTGLNVFLPKAP